MSEVFPSYTEESLARSSIDDLMRLLQQDEDRVPRNVIEHCASRGDLMIEALAAMLDKDYLWGEDQGDGEWWRLLHAVMILGLIESRRAGELLVAYMKRIDDAGDELLQEWLSGYWPALYRNKPRELLDALTPLVDDARYSWHVRGDAMNSIIAWLAASGPAEVDSALDRAARLASSKSEDFDLRVMLGATLLSFARAKDRRMLEQLADTQPDELRWFGREDIVRTYARGGEAPEWTDFSDPWTFYDPGEIEARAAEHTEVPQEDHEALISDTYVRETPKVGRNDPCPCGSGKKYKKCCGA